MSPQIDINNFCRGAHEMCSDWHRSNSIFGIIFFGINVSTSLGIWLVLSTWTPERFGKLGKFGRLAAASVPGTAGGGAGFAIRLTNLGNVDQKLAKISWNNPMKPVSALISLFITAAVNRSSFGCCCWSTVDRNCCCCGRPSTIWNKQIALKMIEKLFILNRTLHTLINEITKLK